MGSFDMTAANAALKILYPQKEITKALYRNNPFFGLVPKRTDFYGLNLQIALRFALTAGASAVFATAQSLKNPSSLAKWNVTSVKYYSLASIDGETIRATKNDKGSLVQAIENETDAALWRLKRNIAIDLYRSGTGSIGNISSGSNVGTPTITLSKIQDITNFEKGMVVTCSATDGSALRTAGATATITGVDRSLGTLTISGNWTGSIAGALAGDFLYPAGDGANGGANVKMAGLGAWVPAAAPAATAFFGLDRTSDVTRLGGVRFNGAGGPIEETLISALALVCREGGDPTHVFMNNADYVNLILALGSKVIYDQATSDEPDVGFSAVKLAAPGATGFVKVFADPNCPKGQAFILQMDTFALWTREEIGFLMDDDQRILREATTDSYELRMGYYGQLVCTAPGYNCNVTL